MYNTIIQSGTFTVAAGVPAVTLSLRSDVDWMEILNYTQATGTTQWASVKFEWQRGMAANDGIAYYHAAATSALNMVSCATGWNGVIVPGFTLINSSASLLGAPIAVTAGTNATQPVYSTGTTTGLAVGSIVRVWGGGHTELSGLDFSIDTITAATSFRLANTLATAPGVANGAGFYRVVAPNIATYKLFYPGNRVIANITQANPAIVTTLVDHGYITGQQVRINVPAGCGMIEMNGLTGTVTSLTAGTFSINIDTTGFTAFNFPLPAAVPFTPAEALPVGVTPVNLTTNLTDATTNQSYIGMILGTTGAVGTGGGPAGCTAGDVIYWKAGKSFNL